ncbi:MAG: potassium channel family protein [Pseudomonadota bacterium]
MTLSIPAMQRVSQHNWFQDRIKLRRSATLLTVVLALLAGHTLQIWSWSVAFMWTGNFTELGDSYYFSAVTYTTLGYGDIVLENGYRIFATFAAVSGLFCFGISTAFLFGVIGRMLPDVFDRR